MKFTSVYDLENYQFFENFYRNQTSSKNLEVWRWKLRIDGNKGNKGGILKIEYDLLQCIQGFYKCQLSKSSSVLHNSVVT